MSISSEIARINNEVSTQADLISQIKSALDGKAAGSGGGGNEIIETCTLTVTLVPNPTIPANCTICYIDAEGMPTIYTVTTSTNNVSKTTTITIQKNSLVAIIFPGSMVNNISGTSIQTTGNCVVPNAGVNGIPIYAAGLPVLVNDISSISITLS